MRHITMSQSSWRQSCCPRQGRKRLLGVSPAARQRWDWALRAASSRFSRGEAGEGLCWGARHPESRCHLPQELSHRAGTCPSRMAAGVGAAQAVPGGLGCSRARAACAQSHEGGAKSFTCRTFPDAGSRVSSPENVNLVAAVSCELYVPNRIGGGLLLSHFMSVGFPTSFNFLSICLVAALSRGSSMGSRRNQVFIFRNCKKSSTQGKYNYFRLHF